MAGKHIGEILIEAGACSREALEQALIQQSSEGGRIGEILQKARAVTEEDVLRALSVQLGIPFAADLDPKQIDLDKLFVKSPTQLLKEANITESEIEQIIAELPAGSSPPAVVPSPR